MTELDPEAYARAGYPHIVDVGSVVWPLYAIASTPLPHAEVAARIEDGTIFAWLNQEFRIGRPRY